MLYRLWFFFREAYFYAVSSLTLNAAAYTAEILRRAIQAVPDGEFEAAWSCGMSAMLLQRRIILPVVMRPAWPIYTNQVVLLLQATSLVSIISIMDITGGTRQLAARHFAAYKLFFSAAGLYLPLVYIVFFLRRFERRIMRHAAAYGKAGRPAEAN
jgi:ABC-type arginine/histidine transport system permease subunit